MQYQSAPEVLTANFNTQVITGNTGSYYPVGDSTGKVLNYNQQIPNNVQSLINSHGGNPESIIVTINAVFTLNTYSTGASSGTLTFTPIYTVGSNWSYISGTGTMTAYFNFKSEDQSGNLTAKYQVSGNTFNYPTQFHFYFNTASGRGSNYITVRSMTLSGTVEVTA